MRGLNRYISASGLLILAIGVASGCSSSTPAGGDASVQASSGPSSSSAMEHMEHNGDSVTTINGEVPPNVPTRVTGSKTVLDVVQDGQRHLVFRDDRPAGTRSPIHEHPYGGTTCMASGEMTLYLEGSAPQVAGPGECYWMPPGLPMTGVNTGGVPAVLYDMFTVPDGQAVWIVVEAGQEDLQKNFDSGNTNGM